jgi:hypothetical protein
MWRRVGPLVAYLQSSETTIARPSVKKGLPSSFFPDIDGVI